MHVNSNCYAQEQIDFIEEANCSVPLEFGMLFHGEASNSTPAAITSNDQEENKLYEGFNNQKDED